jgi:ubiquitin-like-conjugating enzyme ATG10
VAVADEHTSAPRLGRHLVSEETCTTPVGAHVCAQEWCVDVTYSPTWRVPVLYFTARRHRSQVCCNCSERPLTWAEIAVHLPQALHEDLLNSCSGSEDTRVSNASSVGSEVGMWPLLTEELHPITGFPCFMLHPCATAGRMACLNLPQQNTSTSNRGNRLYLLTWLTIFGPAVGLTVSPSFYCLKRSSCN